MSNRATVFCDDLASIDKQCVIMQIDSNILVMRLQRADVVRNYLTLHPRATAAQIVEAMSNKGFGLATNKISLFIYNPTKENGEPAVSQQPLSAADLTKAASIIKEMGGLRNANNALERVRKLIETCGDLTRADEAIRHLDTLSPGKAAARTKAKAVEGQSLAPEVEEIAGA